MTAEPLFFAAKYHYITFSDSLIPNTLTFKGLEGFRPRITYKFTAVLLNCRKARKITYRRLEQTQQQAEQTLLERPEGAWKLGVWSGGNLGGMEGFRLADP